MLEMSSCIPGYHVYRKDWNPVIEELLECKRKIMNNQDRYAVVVIIVCSIFVFSVSDENFPHDEYFPIYGIMFLTSYEDSKSSSATGFAGNNPTILWPISSRSK